LLIQKSNTEIEFIFEEVDATDFEKLEILITKIFEKHTNDSCLANITGGTKPMAIALYNTANKYQNTRVWYIDQNNNITELKSRSLVQIDDMENTICHYFEKLGFKPKEIKAIEDYDLSDFQTTKKLREIYERFPKDFLQLANDADQKNHMTEWKTTNGSSLKWDKNSRSYLFHFSSKKGNRSYSLHSKNIQTLVKKNGWFEIEVAQILSQWSKANELKINVIFPYQSGLDKNEIDIVVRYKSKLIFVECKLQVNDIKDIDKFSIVVKHYGGLSAKSLLFTDQKINERVIEKCKDNNILTFNMQNDYVLFGGLEQSLFRLIESELLTNNKK